MIEIENVSFCENEYHILDFGEINFDPKNNMKTIQYAIDQVSKLGGGTLFLIEGVIPSGPICLKDNVNLNLPFNCYLKFVKNKEFYHTKMFNYEGEKAIRTNSPVSIINCTNVAITGRGVIDGCGIDWRPIKDWKLTIKDFEKNYKDSPYKIDDGKVNIFYPSESSYLGALKGKENISLEESDDYYDYFRPVLISIYNSNKVLLDGITTSNSPAWNIHPLFSKNLCFSNLHVKNEYSAQNGDGIDIESCENVIVSCCEFSVGDDGICLKSGKNKEAREIKIPTKNVVISNNIVYHAHGGIVIGSEMSRGIDNVYCYNNQFIGTDVGIRFKSAMGRGGIVQNISFEKTYMTDIKEQAIIFDMGYSLYKMSFEQKDNDTYSSDEDIPYFKNISISDFICDSSKTFLKINGINKDTISNIHIENAKFSSNTIFDCKNCSNIKLINVLDIKNNELVDTIINN